MVHISLKIACVLLIRSVARVAAHDFFFNRISFVASPPKRSLLFLLPANASVWNFDGVFFKGPLQNRNQSHPPFLLHSYKRFPPDFLRYPELSTLFPRPIRDISPFFSSQSELSTGGCPCTLVGLVPALQVVHASPVLNSPHVGV